MDRPRFQPLTKEKIEELINENSRSLQIPENVYRNILKTSLIQSLADIEDISKAISNKDYLTIRKLSHRVKGAYQNLRINLLGDICLEIENIAKEEGDVVVMSRLHENAQQIISSIEDFFQKTDAPEQSDIKESQSD
jgi:HPt (histidine-containing phosphotransfer) domain-containing protein